VIPRVDRLILVGRNDAFPKAQHVVLGVCVDGTVITSPVSAGHLQCPDCEGVGQVHVCPINPSERDHWETCEMCQGEGQIEPGTLMLHAFERHMTRGVR
jgi:hypothetical protein